MRDVKDGFSRSPKCRTVVNDSIEVEIEIVYVRSVNDV